MPARVTSCSAGASGFGAAVDLASLDGTNGFRLDGIDATDYSGYSVSGAGDVTGDGFGDVIIGAYSADPGGDYNAGESYIVFGKASGFGASLDLATLDGANGFRLDGIEAGDAERHLGCIGRGRHRRRFRRCHRSALPALIPAAIHGAGESYVVFGRAVGVR